MLLVPLFPCCLNYFKELSLIFVLQLASGVPQQTQRQHEHYANKIIRTYTNKPRQSPWSSEAVDAQPSSERWVE